MNALTDTHRPKIRLLGIRIIRVFYGGGEILAPGVASQLGVRTIESHLFVVVLLARRPTCGEPAG